MYRIFETIMRFNPKFMGEKLDFMFRPVDPMTIGLSIGKIYLFGSGMAVVKITNIIDDIIEVMPILNTTEQSHFEIGSRYTVELTEPGKVTIRQQYIIHVDD